MTSPSWLKTTSHSFSSGTVFKRQKVLKSQILDELMTSKPLQWITPLRPGFSLLNLWIYTKGMSWSHQIDSLTESDYKFTVIIKEYEATSQNSVIQLGKSPIHGNSSDNFSNIINYIWMKGKFFLLYNNEHFNLKSSTILEQQAEI